MFSLIPSDANDPQGLMRRKEPNKQTNRTSVASLYVEADEPSLYSRREKLSLQYALRLAANPSNPAHEVTFPPNYVNLYEQKPKAIKSFGIRISPLLESANIKPQNIEKHFTPIFQLGV